MRKESYADPFFFILNMERNCSKEREKEDLWKRENQNSPK
jgi:hypothetical protein